MVATLVLLLSLGLDTLAVAIGLGVGGLPRSRWLRVGLTFAVFEGLMPGVGLLLGRNLTGVLGEAAAWAAGGLLLLLGLLEIREAVSDEEERPPDVAGEAGTRKLLATGLSVSLDELAVGFSLGVLRAPLAVTLGYVAVQAFAATFVGLRLGERAGERLGERAELAAGVILALLGALMLLGQATGARFL